MALPAICFAAVLCGLAVWLLCRPPLVVTVVEHTDEEYACHVSFTVSNRSLIRHRQGDCFLEVRSMTRMVNGRFSNAIYLWGATNVTVSVPPRQSITVTQSVERTYERRMRGVEIVRVDVQCEQK